VFDLDQAVGPESINGSLYGLTGRRAARGTVQPPSLRRQSVAFKRFVLDPFIRDEEARSPTGIDQIAVLAAVKPTGRLELPTPSLRGSQKL
jgi:hypothetical protein